VTVFLIYKVYYSKKTGILSLPSCSIFYEIFFFFEWLPCGLVWYLLKEDFASRQIGLDLITAFFVGIFKIY
jgi:p-aminobenzoyl-glutamate transporter AbgT